jgi:hypothetical protein
MLILSTLQRSANQALPYHDVYEIVNRYLSYQEENDETDPIGSTSLEDQAWFDEDFERLDQNRDELDKLYKAIRNECARLYVENDKAVLNKCAKKFKNYIEISAGLQVWRSIGNLQHTLCSLKATIDIESLLEIGISNRDYWIAALKSRCGNGENLPSFGSEYGENQYTENFVDILIKGSVQAEAMR